MRNRQIYYLLADYHVYDVIFSIRNLFETLMKNAWHKRLKVLVFSQHIAALVAVQKNKKLYFITNFNLKNVFKAQHNRLCNK